MRVSVHTEDGSDVYESVSALLKVYGPAIRQDAEGLPILRGLLGPVWEIGDARISYLTKALNRRLGGTCAAALHRG